MNLIRRIKPRKDKKGILRSYAIFWCSFCEQEVVKQTSHGKRDKSCGCVQYKLSSKSNKGKKRSEEQKQKMKENHADFSGENHPMYGKNQTEEARQKQSKSKKGKKRKPFTEETRQKQSISKIGKNNPMYGKIGELSPTWNNGVSFEKYGIEFNKKLKQRVLERDNYTCQDPNCIEIHNKLHIHHIDYDKKNNSLDNLIILCISCHMKTNPKNKRQYYTEFYQNILKGFI